MFLLNEIIIQSRYFDPNEVIFSKQNDFELPFKKGDLVYFDDYEMISLFNFFQTLKYDAGEYSNFIDFNLMFKTHKSIFDYVNCIGQIKKITQRKIKLNRGTMNRKRYEIHIEFPDGKLLKFNNLRYLKLFKHNSK